MFEIYTTNGNLVFSPSFYKNYVLWKKVKVTNNLSSIYVPASYKPLVQVFSDSDAVSLGDGIMADTTGSNKDYLKIEIAKKWHAGRKELVDYYSDSQLSGKNEYVYLYMPVDALPASFFPSQNYGLEVYDSTGNTIFSSNLDYLYAFYAKHHTLVTDMAGLPYYGQKTISVVIPTGYKPIVNINNNVFSGWEARRVSDYGDPLQWRILYTTMYSALSKRTATSGGYNWNVRIMGRGRPFKQGSIVGGQSNPGSIMDFNDYEHALVVAIVPS